MVFLSASPSALVRSIAGHLSPIPPSNVGGLTKCSARPFEAGECGAVREIAARLGKNANAIV